MSATTEARPPQVTLAAWMVMVGSVAVVLTAFEQISGLRSLKSRDSIEAMLEGPVLKSWGLDVESMINVLHVSAMVAAGCATAAAVLGWHVLHRHLGARLALSIVAVPLFVTGLTSGGFMSSLVAASAGMLWLSPAREWFKTGRWTPPTPPTNADARSRHQDLSAFDAIPPGATAPVATGVPTSSPAPAERPYASDQPIVATTARAAVSRGALHQRPPALVAAFVVTVVAAGLVMLAVGSAVVVMAMSPDLVIDELERQRPDVLESGVSLAQLQASTFVMGGVCLAWCLIALTFAGFAMARRPWARVGLVITAAASAGACLLSAIYVVPVALVPAIAAIATVALLRRRDVRAWFDGPHS